MIELDLIKTSDKASSLRGQLNTAFSEIMTNQAMIGTPVGATVKAYLGSVLVTTINMDNLHEKIYFDCLPEPNGVFVSAVHGGIYFSSLSSAVSNIEITVPAIKLPSRDTTISTFVKPEDLDITEGSTKFSAGTCTCCDTTGDKQITNVGLGCVTIDSSSTALTIYAAVRGDNAYMTGNFYVYF